MGVAVPAACISPLPAESHVSVSPLPSPRFCLTSLLAFSSATQISNANSALTQLRGERHVFRHSDPHPVHRSVNAQRPATRERTLTWHAPLSCTATRDRVPPQRHAQRGWWKQRAPSGERPTRRDATRTAGPSGSPRRCARHSLTSAFPCPCATAGQRGHQNQPPPGSLGGVLIA